MKAEERQKIIEGILAENARRERLFFECVQRFDIQGNDGKFYSHVFPRGVRMAEPIVRRPYWVSLTREGTTVGKRYGSAEEWKKAEEARIAASNAKFRRHLEAESDERVERQAAFWLPKAGAA